MRITYDDFVSEEYAKYCSTAKSEGVDPMEYDDFVTGSDYLIPLFKECYEKAI